MIQTFKKYLKYHDIRQKFYMNLGSPLRVLDLGCGTGNTALVLKEMYPEVEVFGVDQLEEKEIPDFVNYQKINLDSDVLPYPDNSFDSVIFIHVIEHLSSPLRLGSEINRVLKNGGKLYIETPNWTSVLVPSIGFKREQSYPFNFYDDPTHVKPWSKHGLFEFLRKSKLRVEKVGTVRNWIKMPFDLVFIIINFIKGDRPRIVGSFWNLYGWCIYGIGVKDANIQE